ncbi:hypothetical protein ACWEVO_06805, partial [Micromonospora sp. NPDC003776]
MTSEEPPERDGRHRNQNDDPTAFLPPVERPARPALNLPWPDRDERGPAAPRPPADDRPIALFGDAPGGTNAAAAPTAGADPRRPGTTGVSHQPPAATPQPD